MEGIAQEGLAPDEIQLSRLVGISHSGPRQSGTPGQDLLEPWADQIYQWLTVDRLQMTRIQELLAQRGCPVSYPSLRRFILKRNWRKLSRVTVRMEDIEPGEVAELYLCRLGYIQDQETGRRCTVWALLVVLAYSRYSFVWPTYSQKLEDVIAGLEAAWAFFGGIPRYLVIDNFPAAVAGADALHPRLTRGFLEYSQHRGFITDPARVRHPKDKPKVERSVQYARERFFKGGDFKDLAHLRSEATRWCRSVAGMRIHGTPPAASPCKSSWTRSATPCPPGTVSPTRSPTGAPPRCIPTTTWPASTPSTSCLPPCARQDSRWKSAWVRSWCASTTGDAWSRSIPASLAAAAPLTLPITPLS